MLYHSRAIDGRAIAVSGIVQVPDRPAPKGGWPIVTYAHGTTGLAEPCAPSKKPSPVEFAAFAAVNAAGYAIAATDYEGLGTPGRHPYLVGDSQGRGVLDIVRAARSVKGTSISSRFVIYGYSQGGHAALFAGELARTWTPDLRLLGVVAGAPPSQLTAIGEASTTSPFRGYVLMVAAGQLAARPSLPVDAVLTAKGQEVLPVVDTGCTKEVFAAVNAQPFESLVVPGGIATPEWTAALAASEPGNRTTTAPLLIVHGDKDEQVPFATSATLLAKLCARKMTVLRKTYAGLDHGGAALGSFADVQQWIIDRFAGRKAPTSCP